MHSGSQTTTKATTCSYDLVDSVSGLCFPATSRWAVNRLAQIVQRQARPVVASVVLESNLPGKAGFGGCMKQDTIITGDSFP